MNTRNFIRWSLYLPFDLLGMRAINTSYRNVENNLRPLIIQHRETLNPESPRDYIDAFLVEMRARSAESKSSFFFGLTLPLFEISVIV